MWSSYLNNLQKNNSNPNPNPNPNPIDTSLFVLKSSMSQYALKTDLPLNHLVQYDTYTGTYTLNNAQLPNNTAATSL